MKLRLLHWNILYEEKPANILSVVKQIKPDIFCCQEISNQNENSKAVLDGLSQLFEHHYFEPAKIIGEPGNAMNLGDAIFSKFPMSGKKRVYLWNGPNPTSKNQHEERIYIEATLAIGNQKLTVATTHLSFAPYFSDTPDRLEQAGKLMEEILTKQANFVITGDFNSAPETKIIKDIKSHLISAGPPDSEPSFTTIPFTYLGFEVKGLDWRVDYIFTTPDIKVISSRIIQTSHSDHLPILAEIKL